MIETKSDTPKVVAFYLPQFHPIPENDLWWGKGFTEWTNVAKARPLFRSHYQPRIPADLGFYDLRFPEIREAQAQLAREAGISVFCYWHYWFGGGKRLLEKPLNDVIKSGLPQFPFCLAWANTSWNRKNWNNTVSRVSKDVLMEQTYPGRKDVEDHFYAMLPAFKDKRYFRIHDKLAFLFYYFEKIPEREEFVDLWQSLARQNGLAEFFFIGHTAKAENLRSPDYRKLDAINLHPLREAFRNSRTRRLASWLLRRPMSVVPYAKAMRRIEKVAAENERVFPTIYPNWDTTPRLGVIGDILYASTPELFKQHVQRIMASISNRDASDKIVFLKSWNEWAEGNYMEPDLRFGKGYIHALEEALTGRE